MQSNGADGVERVSQSSREALPRASVLRELDGQARRPSVDLMSKEPQWSFPVLLG